MGSLLRHAQRWRTNCVKMRVFSAIKHLRLESKPPVSGPGDFYKSDTNLGVIWSTIHPMARLLWGWLMRGRIRYSVCVLGVSVLFSAMGNTQQGSAGGGKPPSTRVPTRPPATTGPQPQQPVFFAGKVILDTGTPPPTAVAIIRTCNGNSRRQTYSLGDGSFSFMLGDRNFSETTLDATEDSRGFGTDSPFFRTNQSLNNPMDPRSVMADCELRADLPGYSSSYIRLDPSMTNSNVGVIILHNRSKKADGMVTVASLEVPAKARKEYEKGSELLEKGDMAKAEKSLRKAIDQYPKFAEAWTRLGDLEQRRKNTDAAMNDYQEAISADPNLPLPYLRMAFLEAVAGNWEQTRRLTERLLALDPTDFPVAYYYQGVAEFNLQHTAKAESVALRAESMDKTHSEPRIELLLASIYSAKQDYSAAAEHYRAYLKLVPDGPLTEHVKSNLVKTEEMAKSRSSPSTSVDK